MGAGEPRKGVIFAKREGGESYIALTKKARLRIRSIKEIPVNQYRDTCSSILRTNRRSSF